MTEDNIEFSCRFLMDGTEDDATKRLMLRQVLDIGIGNERSQAICRACGYDPSDVLRTTKPLPPPAEEELSGIVEDLRESFARVEGHEKLKMRITADVIAGVARESFDAVCRKLGYDPADVRKAKQEAGGRPQ